MVDAEGWNVENIGLAVVAVPVVLNSTQTPSAR